MGADRYEMIGITSGTHPIWNNFQYISESKRLYVYFI